MKRSKLYLKLFTLALLLAMVNKSTAQTIIKGKVVDALSRQPLEAASINIKGKDNERALTDESGNFLLKNINENAVISISHIGYKTLSATADHKNIARNHWHRL